MDEPLLSSDRARSQRSVNAFSSTSSSLSTRGFVDRSGRRTPGVPYNERIAIDSPFNEEGICDDQCAKCFNRLCCAPPPFKVAIFPVVILLSIFTTLYALFAWDLTGYCARSQLTPPPCVPRNMTDPYTNTTRLVPCPDFEGPCAYFLYANTPVGIWSLFFMVVIAGYAILRAIVSVFWWIFRALSGKHGAMWAILKPVDWAVHLLLWDALFFFSYKRWLYSALPPTESINHAIAVIVFIISFIFILATVLSTLVVRYLTRPVRYRANEFRSKAKLVDKLVKGQETTFSESLTAGLTHIISKGAENAKMAAEASKRGADVVVEMAPIVPQSIDDDDLKKAWDEIDASEKGHLTRDELCKAAEVKDFEAQLLWSVFSPEIDGIIYFPEFAMGVRDVERVLHDTLNEIENRVFLGSVIQYFIMILLWSLGWSTSLEAIQLHVSTLVSAMAVFSVAFTMAFNGLFGRMLNAFVFLLVSHPYYKNDVVVIGGDTVIVKQITLLNTYASTLDGKWAMFDNANIAGSKILNLSRSTDCIFVFENSVHPNTPMKALETWRATIQAHIKSRPDKWRNFEFNIVNVNADNKFVVEMRAYARGASWAHMSQYNPIREQLWIVVHHSAVQLGIYKEPKDLTSPDLVKLVEPDESKKDK